MAVNDDRDPRIYFAAERTFLAWIRTGLALMGFGFVVARFGLFLKQIAASHDSHVRSYGFSLWVGSSMVMVGVLMNLVAALRHIQIIHRLNAGLPVIGRPSYTAVAIALMLALAGAAMVIFLLSVE